MSEHIEQGKLLPCPCCGSKCQFKHSETDVWIRCLGCGLEFGYFGNESKAMEKFNTRNPPQDSRGDIKCQHEWSHKTTGYGYQVCMKDGCNAERFDVPSAQALVPLNFNECMNVMHEHRDERTGEIDVIGGMQAICAKLATKAQPEVLEALENLVNKLKLIHKDSRYLAVWSLYQNHGNKYDGPQYVDELEKAEQVLSLLTTGRGGDPENEA